MRTNFCCSSHPVYDFCYSNSRWQRQWNRSLTTGQLSRLGQLPSYLCSLVSSLIQRAVKWVISCAYTEHIKYSINICCLTVLHFSENELCLKALEASETQPGQLVRRENGKVPSAPVTAKGFHYMRQWRQWEADAAPPDGVWDAM